MNLLHLAPVWLPVHRTTPGGIETFLAQLCRAQQEQGCTVQLLASGDSDLDLPIVPATPECVVELMGRGAAALYEHYEQEVALRAIAMADGVDVIHSHLGAAGFAVGSAFPSKTVVHTLHGQPTDDLCWLLARHPELEIVAVSDAQARALRVGGARVSAVVHNGLRIADVPFWSEPGEDLVFLGRIEPAKGVDVAIEVARRTGHVLHVAGPVIDGEYFDEILGPARGDRIRYEGVLVGEQKHALLAQAACVLMPSRWNEPFGMVAIEAMASGIPVVGTASGALPEIIEDGLTGYVGESVDELAGAVVAASGLDREQIRQRAEARFGIDTVARRYDAVYARITA